MTFRGNNDISGPISFNSGTIFAGTADDSSTTIFANNITLAGAPAKVMLFAKIVVDESSAVPAKIVPLLKEIGPEISLLPLKVIIPDPEYANPPLPLNLPEKVFVPELRNKNFFWKIKR